MLPAHKNFDILLNLDKVLNKSILFVSERTPDRSKLYNWVPSSSIRHLLYQALKSLDMTFFVLKSKTKDLIFIFEHKPWYSLFLYLACLIKGRPTFFIVIDFQQRYKLSFFRKTTFRILLFFEKHFSFWAVHLELSDKYIPDTLKFSKPEIIMKIPPKSISPFLNKKLDIKSTIKIGFVGMMRSDKPIMKLIDILSNYKNSKVQVEFKIGTPQWQNLEKFTSIPFSLIDTSYDKDYVSFIKSLHIYIGVFEKESFYFRSSGVLNDVLCLGCFAIVPNYPVLKHQISHPIKVGATYDDISDISSVLDSSIDYILNNEIDFGEYIKTRTENFILEDLAKQILTVI